jgi:hypothetical protein
MESFVWKAHLQLGFDHILDPNGYDHILYVASLTAVYTFRDWKKILLLVTAFTLGHSLTLALAALDMVTFNPDVIETLIPVTIIVTALFQMYRVLSKTEENTSATVAYVLTTGFGLIHGLGFSNYFMAILGKESSIVQPLLAFNIGVELGQLIIVLMSLLLGSALVLGAGLSRKNWTLLISSVCVLMGIYLLIS